VLDEADEDSLWFLLGSRLRVIVHHESPGAVMQSNFIHVAGEEGLPYAGKLILSIDSALVRIPPPWGRRQRPYRHRPVLASTRAGNALSFGLMENYNTSHKRETFCLHHPTSMGPRHQKANQTPPQPSVLGKHAGKDHGPLFLPSR
jgi:hypothetical protein